MKTPFSVHMIVALEWLLGGLAGLYCLMFLFIGYVDLSRRGASHFGAIVELPIEMAAISWAAFYIATKLRQGRYYAWIASWFIGIAILLLGCYLFHEGRYGTGPDDGYGLIAGPFIVLLALAGIVFLTLPQTRRYCDPTSQLADRAEPSL